MSKLTPKQSRFVEEFLRDFNASAAARRAGYSEKSAGNIGWENVKKREIQVALAKAIAARREQVGLTAEWVLREMVDTYKEARAAEQYGPANRGLELLGKHIGMFADKLDVTLHGEALLLVERVGALFLDLLPEDRLEEYNRRLSLLTEGGDP